MLHNHNDYNAGDRVKVINSDCNHFEKCGVVKARKRYVIVVDIDDNREYFMAHELIKEGR